MSGYGAYEGLDVHEDAISVAVAFPGRQQREFRNARHLCRHEGKASIPESGLLLFCLSCALNFNSATSHDQADMPVPAMPGTGLTMVKAEIVPGSLETLLDGPAQPGSAGQFRQTGAGRAEDEMTCRFLRIPAVGSRTIPS